MEQNVVCADTRSSTNRSRIQFCLFSPQQRSDRWAEFVGDEKVTNIDVATCHRKYIIVHVHILVFDLLTPKVKTLQEISRNCVLCIDEMAIIGYFYYLRSQDKIIGFEDTGFSRTFKPATQAMVIMARDIHSEWKQPLAYFLVNGSCKGDELHTIVRETIDKVQKTGLNICAFISDQGSNFYSLSQRLGVTPEHSYFSMNDKNIFYMFNTPPLLKSVRNHF